MNYNNKRIRDLISKKESNGEFKVSKFVKYLFSKILICIIILITGLIVLKYDSNNSKIIYKFIYETNFSFASFKSFVNKYFKDIIPFDGNINSSKEVFNESLKYNSLSIYKDGVSLSVTDNYLIPIISEGIVTFIGKKDDFNNTVIIQTSNGVDIWYGNVSSSNVKIYDYVKKGEFLGMTDGNTLYLAFYKDGKALSYKEYI